MKDKQKRKKERTWAEAARMVLENFSDAPMTPKQILHVIQTKGLKEMSGTAPLACLVTMLHSQVRGDRVKNSIFFKLPGRMSLFTLKKNALQWTKSPTESETSTDTAGAATAHTTCGTSSTAGQALAQPGPTDTTEQESCGSTETNAATASGENDASIDENSSSAFCSTEPQAPSQPQTRLSRAAVQPGRTDMQTQHTHIQHAQTRLSRSRQSGRQRKKSVMMPRVVLTPLKVNGEHVPSGPMKRSRGGVDVDFETPGSILVNTNIRALINVRTFSAFPTHSQQQLLQLLPEVDRQVGPDGMARLSSSALNNEFFTHASQSWKERLAEGEFTHEMQVRFRQEMEKEKKVEAWKEKFFEEYHGQKSGLTQEESLKLTMTEATDVAASVLESDMAVVAAGTPKRRSSVGRRRRDGRMRRRTRADLRRRARRTLCKAPPPVLQAPEATDASTSLDPSPVSITFPMSDNSVVQGEVVLQAESVLELPAVCGSLEPEPSPALESATVPAPTITPSPSPASTSANEEAEVSTCLLPEESAPALASTSSPSSSSSSSSSPAFFPSSPPDRQGDFAVGLDSSSSSSSSTSSSSAAAAVDPLDDTASVVTSVTGGTATSSRESSPSASPAPTPAPIPQSKEQKRRPDEAQAFSSFPEKRPRLDDRQSFRTTIDGVLSEKPQPTAEEPKVPPIRIQLSRIKPPWVKGPPTYQICPRIVPSGEGSRRSGTGGARTLADIKARAQQARAQREAAAAIAATGDGAGPGGGGLRAAAGLSDRSSGRRAREHPGPVEPGGDDGGRGGGEVEEQGSPADPHSSGAQLQLPNVGATEPPTPQPSPSPSLSTTSTSLSSEPPQTPTPTPSQDDTSGEKMTTEEGAVVDATATVQSTSNGLSHKVVALPALEQDTMSESVASCYREQCQGPPSMALEREEQPSEGPFLAPTSIPDSVPRFGAQGIDVIQSLATTSQALVREQGKGSGGGGVIQYSSHHVGPLPTPSPPARERQQADVGSPEHVPSSVEEKEDEAGGHSDSTETASDCENESQEDDQQHSNHDWRHHLATRSNSQQIIRSPPLQNQQPVIQAHVSNRHGHTVIQPCFPNGLAHPQPDQQSIPTAHSQEYRAHNNVPTKKEPGDEPKVANQSSGEEDCRGAPKSSIPLTTTTTSTAASKRVASSTRPVSSVEANNPLVTQLLQGSLPLEKVLPQSHSANRLEINRLPGVFQSKALATRNPGPCVRVAHETIAASSGPDISSSQNRGQQKSPGTGRSVSCLMEATAMQQFVSPQPSGAVPPGAVPVITSLPPSSSSSCSPVSRRLLDHTSQKTMAGSVIIKESPGLQPSQGDTPDRPQTAIRTTPNGPSPPHADPCPSEMLPAMKINWRPPQSQPPHHQQISTVSSVKSEVNTRPSCQALAKSSPTTPMSVTKKEPGNCVDGYLSGGAMEGLLNMEMTLARMAKKEHSKVPYSSLSSSSPTPCSSASSLPFHLYGKLPKQGGGMGGVSYTANMSVMDGSGFSRSLADGVLQLRPRLGTTQTTTLSIQAFADSAAEEVALKCSCRLKAMIMCQGCGAFCHDDCIGPSKLCVSCLVVR
ncbi:putative Polycomb group protein ASXL1 [Lampris incognitus]|uniref:putative Polycomb group protein ASXL1 n=1 Tax=Lampris incognitus TaxID=2546036 RepID=UPI0024B51ACE|nr:putative Polycomb group protein ASXL1 [Lampris incognitus]